MRKKGGAKDMTDKEDKLFYAGYGLVIIMLGVVVMLFSVGAVDGWSALGLWVLTMGLILIGLGNVKTESAPSGSMALMGSGLFLAVISIAILGIILNMINTGVAIAIMILLVGLVLVAFGMRRSKSIS